MILLFLACRDAECIQNDRGVPSLSTTELDFGELDPGASATQAVTITNVGTNLLPVGDIEIGAETPDFTFTWDTTGVECATTIPDSMWAEDTGGWQPPVKDSGTTAFPGEVHSGFWLEPGCSLDVQVTYTATTPGQVQDALVVYRAGGLDRDLTLDSAASFFQKVVWLKGRTEGRSEATWPEIVGNVVDIDSFVNYPGDTLGARVRTTDPAGGGISYMWNTDLADPTFDDPSAAETHLALDPDLSCSPDGEWKRGETYNIYVIVYDVRGHQVWAAAPFAVYPPTYLSEPTCVPRASHGCGDKDAHECGDTAAAALWLAFVRRWRRPASR